MVGNGCVFEACRFLLHLVGKRVSYAWGSNLVHQDVHTRTHNPLSIIADSDALTCFLELEVLQKLDATGIFRISLEASLALPGQPFWKRAGGGGA